MSRGRVAWIVVAVASVAEAVRWHLWFLLNDRLFDGDAAQHVFWMYRWQDPALFPNDIAADYFSSAALSPPGHWLLFRLATFVFDPLIFSEALFILLVPLTLWLLYLCGRQCGGTGGGVLAVLLFIAFNGGLWLVGGYARCHAPAALLLCVLGWLRRDGRFVAGGLIYAVLFYPPIALLAGSASIVMLLARRTAWTHWNIAVAGGLAAGVLLGAFATRDVPEHFGPRVTYEQAVADPVFGPDGRNKFFVEDWKTFYFTGGRTGIGAQPATALVSAALLLLGLMLRPRQVPAALWVLVGIGLLLWAAAHATLFLLYLPSRHALYAVPIFGFLAAASWLPQLLNRLRLPSWNNATATAAVVAALVLIGVQTYVGHRDRPGPDSTNFAPELDGAYAVLRALPKDTLVAAHPEDATLLPMATKRSVLTNREVTIAYHVGYYAMQEPRLWALFEAYYGPDWSTVTALHEEFGVDVLLLNKRRLKRKDGAYYEPFREKTLRLLDAADVNGMAAWEPPPERILWQGGKMTLLWLGPLDEMPHL